MWGFILTALILLSVLSIIYLAGRFARFSMIHKIAKGRKSIRFLAGLALAVLIFFGLERAFGIINAEICILHCVAFWLLCDAAGRLVEKKRFARKGQFLRGDILNTSPVHERKYYAGMSAIGITAVYLACAWYLSHHVWRTEYDICADKPVGSLRIVQIADSHVGNTFDGDGFLAHIKTIQKEEPDIVVVTGDFVDDDTSKEDMEAACRALGTLKTAYGVYYVFGNHDKGYYDPQYRGYSGGDLTAELEKNNVTALQDETVLLDGRFYLIGRQDRSEEQRGNGRLSMKELADGLDPQKYSIVLDHQPHDYDAQSEAGVDLVLSGHTHGGHFFPLNHLGEWLGIDDKAYGHEKRENTDFIVTSGIAEWAVKFRTGCRSEYAVIAVQGTS